MKLIKFLLLNYLIVGIITAEIIDTPYDHFEVQGIKVFYDHAAVSYIDDQGNVKKIGFTTYANHNDLSLYKLYNLNDQLVGTVEEHSKSNSTFGHERVFLLKDSKDLPIGILEIHYNYGYASYDSYDLQGNALFHSDRIIYKFFQETFMGIPFATNEFCFLKYARETNIENLNIFENHPELWLHYLLIKIVTWQNWMIG